MINSNLCIECGCDTSIEGYVNRIPAQSDTMEGYLCGGCLSQWEDEHDLLVADGALDFDLTNNEDVVLSILEDRVNNALLPEERIAARHRRDKAIDHYSSAKWIEDHQWS